MWWDKMVLGIVRGLIPCVCQVRAWALQRLGPGALCNGHHTRRQCACSVIAKQQASFPNCRIVSAEVTGASGKRRLADLKALAVEKRLQVIEPDVRLLG